jgi:hypothetical protein
LFDTLLHRLIYDLQGGGVRYVAVAVALTVDKFDLDTQVAGCGKMPIRHVICR